MFSSLRGFLPGTGLGGRTLAEGRSFRGLLLVNRWGEDLPGRLLWLLIMAVSMGLREDVDAGN